MEEEEGKEEEVGTRYEGEIEKDNYRGKSSDWRKGFGVVTCKTGMELGSILAMGL